MLNTISDKNINIKHLLFGIIPIIIWSLVAATVKHISLPDEGIYVAYYSIFFGAIFSLFFSFYNDKKFISDNISIIKATPKVSVLIFVTSLLICGHYFSIYYVFSTDYVVQGNVINYMWPLFSVIFSKLFIPEKNKYSKTSDILFVFMAFVGAILIVSGEELSLNFISDPKMLSLSFLSAFCAAGYFTLSKKIKDSIKGEYTHFSLPLGISLFFLILIAIKFPQILDVRKEVIYLGFGLGLFSIFLSNTLWITSSHISKNHAFSSIAYFVPVLSTALILYYNNEPYNNYLLSGLGLIVISNFLIHQSKELVHAVNICFSILILYCGINLLVSPINIIQPNSMITITATVFTFFAAFLLNRVWNQKKDEEIVLFKLLDDINKFANKAKLDIDERNHIFKDLRDKVINKNHAFNINYYITTLYAQYDYKPSKKTFELLRQLHLVRTPSITLPEFLIILLLSSVSAIYVTLYRENSIMGDFMSIVFASSISYITYILFDFDRNGFLNKNRLILLVKNVEYFDTRSIEKQKKVLPNILSLFLIGCLLIICYFVIIKNFT